MGAPKFPDTVGGYNTVQTNYTQAADTSVCSNLSAVLVEQVRATLASVRVGSGTRLRSSGGGSGGGARRKEEARPEEEEGEQEAGKEFEEEQQEERDVDKGEEQYRQDAVGESVERRGEERLGHWTGTERKLEMDPGDEKARRDSQR